MQDSKLYWTLPTGSIAISAFAFLVGIPIGITNFTIGLKRCVVTSEIKQYESINKEKKKSIIK